MTQMGNETLFIAIGNKGANFDKVYDDFMDQVITNLDEINEEPILTTEEYEKEQLRINTKF